MIIQSITYKQLPEAIKVSFEKDKDIYDLYDPNVKVENIEDIVKDIYKKLGENELYYKGVYEKGRLVGYFAYNAQRQILISFALNVEYRQRKYLKEFYSLIKREIGKFDCYLYMRNIRAINWLKKMGMQAEGFNKMIIKLTLK